MEVDNHSPPGESDTFAGSTSLENVAENPVDPAAGNQTITSKSDSAEGTGDDEINVATTITKDAKSTNKKSSRKRKKHIFNNIRQTMEFYFSDANLSKDRFLMRLIETNPGKTAIQYTMRSSILYCSLFLQKCHWSPSWRSTRSKRWSARWRRSRKRSAHRNFCDCPRTALRSPVEPIWLRCRRGVRTIAPYMW